jgi:hypothetical protein
MTFQRRDRELQEVEKVSAEKPLVVKKYRWIEAYSKCIVQNNFQEKSDAFLLSHCLFMGVLILP